MDQIHTDPKFVREREAWYKAGAAAMAGYSAISVLVVEVIAGVAFLFLDISPYQIAIIVVFGTWVCIAVMNGYINITARHIARRGGVEIAPF